MLSRTAKAAFYSIAGPAMRVNGAIYRATRAPRGDGIARVHLGPGQTKYIEGFINVDANAFTARCDLWADLRHPLPFRDATVDAVYSHHVIEHLPALAAHFAQVFRVLKPGGVYRVGGPNADSAIQQFLAGNKEWFGSWPDNRKSIGGRMENFLMCRGEHLTILTSSFVEELLRDAGFSDISKCLPRIETSHPALFRNVLATEDAEDPAAPHTLIFEAVKPAL